MDVFKLIELCRENRGSKHEYEKLKIEVEKEYDKLSEEDKSYFRESDALEELEMSIEWYS